MPTGQFHPPTYQRHCPERTPLYRTVAAHARTSVGLSEAQGTPLPRFVKEEFDAYLACGILAHGFIRLACETCNHETLIAFSCKRSAHLLTECPSCGTRRMNEAAAV